MCLCEDDFGGTNGTKCIKVVVHNSDDTVQMCVCVGVSHIKLTVDQSDDTIHYVINLIQQNICKL